MDPLLLQLNTSVYQFFFVLLFSAKLYLWFRCGPKSEAIIPYLSVGPQVFFPLLLGSLHDLFQMD
jgi:hypothetical protein